MARPVANLSVAGMQVEIRRAVLGDVPEIVQLLADDPLGRSRESRSTEDDLTPYRQAFSLIDGNDRELLVVACLRSEVIGTLQISFIPGLSRRGALRAQIEGVRIRDDFRSRGLGRAIFEWAIGLARSRGCSLVQLTTDKTRADAHRFYGSLGFSPSHEGFKLAL
ncbi:MULTISPECIES: GNAT family N-acetyltransferase [Micrococcaceae]|uniref:GNAT family N-acetyltransferase n=1 Tax=unclassified Kocuria TaxID=2649579 RepID=UPI001EE0CF8F|nr:MULTISPECIES: GNAT family N-acetyltransferase [unclassified Kocuria]